jgi:hypothetical protein
MMDCQKLTTKSTDITDLHNITEILLKVAPNTINPPETHILGDFF